MSHPVVHFELWSPNPESTSKFYANVFGWKINYTPALAYWLIDTGATIGPGGASGGVNGGMFKPGEGPLPALLSLYMHVDDVAAHVRKAEAAGAKTLIPETAIPGVGWSAVLLDPEGRAFGVFKPLPPPPAAPKARPKPAARKAKASKKPSAAARQPAKKAKRATKKK